MKEQRERIIDYMLEHKVVTLNELERNLHIGNASSRISEIIRVDGIKIYKRDVYRKRKGEVKRLYREYSLKEFPA